MADDGVASCQLCLRADERDSMLIIEIPHHLIEGAAPMTICRQCVGTIAYAARKALEAEGVEVEDSDDRSTE